MRWREDGVLSLIRSRVRELKQRVVEQRAPVSKDDIEEIERLSNLAAIDDASQSRAFLRIAAIVLANTLFALGLFVILTHVHSTNIVLTMSVSELRFETLAPPDTAKRKRDSVSKASNAAPETTLDTATHDSARQMSIRLTETVPVRYLEANGDSGVTLGESKSFVPADQAVLVPTPSSTLSLASFNAKPKTTVTVEKVEPYPSRFRLLVEDRSIEPSASLKGTADLTLDGRTQRIRYSPPQPITFVRRDDVVDLTLVVTDTSQDLFFRPVRISALEPFRVVDTGSGVDSISTLRTARLTFTELKTPPRDIHPSEILQLVIKRDGRLRELSLRPNSLVADFTGIVKDIRIGNETLMPTWFEWAAAQNAAAVLWSVGTYIVVTFLAAWRWLRKPT